MRRQDETTMRRKGKKDRTRHEIGRRRMRKQIRDRERTCGPWRLSEQRSQVQLAHARRIAFRDVEKAHPRHRARKESTNGEIDQVQHLRVKGTTCGRFASYTSCDASIMVHVSATDPHMRYVPVARKTTQAQICAPAMPVWTVTGTVSTHD